MARHRFLVDDLLSDHAKARNRVRNEALGLAARVNDRIAKDSERNLPADERRGAFLAEPEGERTAPYLHVGILGGQGRSGQELDRAIDPLALLALGALLFAVAVAAVG